LVSIFEEVFKRIQNGETIALVTVVETSGSTPGKVGSKMLVNHDGYIKGTIGGGILEGKVIELARKSLKDKKIGLFDFNLTKEEASLDKEAICGGKIKVFIDIIEAKEKIIIFGAGHIATFLSKFAKEIGMEVIIIDERIEFANKERFPGADRIFVLEPDEAVEKIRYFSSSYIVIVTRGHLKDEIALYSVINLKSKYIGMIGSTQKNKVIFNNLIKKGIKQEKLKKVFTPIGLDIGAETPGEIAISIIAEIIKTKRDKQDKEII